MGLGVFYCLQAFANGGVSLTGLEAVSNGISRFRTPEARNGRMRAGRHVLDPRIPGAGHVAARALDARGPIRSGHPDRGVAGGAGTSSGPAGSGTSLFFVVQAATVLILFTGGNTSFNGFPYLASFVAGDSFLPRQLTKRGHRLAFSNGIFVLAVVAILLIIAFKAQLNALVGLYAIGVFTGFTFAGFGMVKHHLRIARTTMAARLVDQRVLRERCPSPWSCILLVTKFTRGRLDRRRRRTADVLRADPPAPAVRRGGAAARDRRRRRHRGACPATPCRRRAGRPARHGGGARRAVRAHALRPDELRVVHFNIDVGRHRGAEGRVEPAWSGASARSTSSSAVTAASSAPRSSTSPISSPTARPSAPCCCPRRAFTRGSSASLHDRTADRIADAVGTVAHVAATIVPFNVEASPRRIFRTERGPPPTAAASRSQRWRRPRARAPRDRNDADQRRWRSANGSVSRDEFVRCACRPPRAPRISSARSPTTPATCCSCSRDARRFQGSSRERG